MKHARTARVCKHGARHIKDILTLTVWDDKLGAEFKELKTDDKT